MISKIIFLGQALLIMSCTAHPDKQVNNQLEIPLFDFERIEPRVIYVSHAWLNKRPPTLIRMEQIGNIKRDNVILTENDRVRVSDVQVSQSNSFAFSMGFNSFPDVDVEVLKIKQSNKSSISPHAYFFVIPGYKYAMFLDDSNIHTKSGRDVLKWLKENISKISIYETINIWRLEHNQEPSEAMFTTLKEKSYKVDEELHLNRRF